MQNPKLRRQKSAQRRLGPRVCAALGSKPFVIDILFTIYYLLTDPAIVEILRNALEVKLSQTRHRNAARATFTPSHSSLVLPDYVIAIQLLHKKTSQKPSSENTLLSKV